MSELTSNNGSTENYLHDKWASVLTAIQGYGLESRYFNTWLNPLRPQAIRDETIVLETSNLMAQTWIPQQYGSLLERAIEEVFGEKKTLIFRFNKELPEGGFLPEMVNSEPQEVPTQERITKPQTPNPPNPKRSANPDDPYKVNPTYTFETFVQGAHNKLAIAAAEELIELRRVPFNTLFIYGEGDGLGRTHLLQAIVNALTGALYVPTDFFVTDWHNAIQGDSYKQKNIQTTAFKERYRSPRVLAVDDIENLAGAAPQEFLLAVEDRIRHNKFVVISSHYSLDSLEELSKKPIPPKLINVLRRGQVAELRSPNLDERISLLKSTASRLGYIPNLGMITQIAKSHRSIPHIIGALHHVTLYARTHSLGLTANEEQTRQILNGEIPKGPKPTLTPPVIKEALAEALDIPSDKISSPEVSSLTHIDKSRGIKMADVRGACMLLARRTHYSPSDVYHVFGFASASSASQAATRTRKRITSDPALRELEKTVREALTPRYNFSSEDPSQLLLFP